ncbi:MAG: VTT domain-containing protein [Ilumatobacteraceae bacterium]
MFALFDIQQWLEQGGLLILAAIVFAESGLFVGFFLPGDSLLFIAGFLASGAGGHRLPAIPWVMLTAVVAAIVGDQVGYLFGRRVGPSLFDRPKSRLFNPANVRKAHDFLDTYGPKTIVLARFVPIVRTFAPIVAGVGKMHYRTFITFNVLGGLMWGAGVTLLGYFLGEIDAVKHNLELAILAVVAISLLPMAVELLKHRRQAAVAD